MIIIDHIEQGSPEWHRMRLGVITASNAINYSSEPKLAPIPDDFTHSKDGKINTIRWGGNQLSGTNKAELITQMRESLPRVYSDMRQGYIAELSGQVATGLIPEEINFKQCEWGKTYEDEARAYFEFETGLVAEQVSFIYRDKEKRFGVSPDAIIKGKKIGLEIKCPFTTKVFVEFLTCGKIKEEYMQQCQFSMWVTGFDAWYFANYDPRIRNKKLHYVLIERDKNYMDKYDNAEKPFIADMGEMLEKLNVEFGQQWFDEMTDSAA